MSFDNLYENQSNAEKIHQKFTSEGYELYAFSPAFVSEKTGQTLQADYLYLRKDKDDD